MTNFPEATDGGSAIDTDAVRAWLASNIGEVLSITLQPRWRPMWYADVRRNGEILKLCVRGDRIDTIAAMTLRHEMTVQDFLFRHGVKVAKVYGWVDGANAYVMDRVPGEHSLVGLSDEQRDAFMDDYMRELAKVHMIPAAEAEAAGIEGGRTPREIAFYPIEQYRLKFRQLKRRPDPFVEFVLQFLDRQIDVNHQRKSLIAWDAGQFMQHEGKFVCIIDLEVAHVGDPLWDLAMLRSRDPTLGFGDINRLYRVYEAATGTRLDRKTLQLYSLFDLISCAVSYHAALIEPTPDSNYTNNLKWVHVNNVGAVDTLADIMGLDLPEVTLADGEVCPWQPAFDHAVRSARNVAVADEYGRYKRDELVELVEYLSSVDAQGRAVLEANLRDVAELVGSTPANWLDADKALEDFVLADDGSHDIALIGLFNRRNNRLRLLNGPAGRPVSERRRYQKVTI